MAAPSPPLADMPVEESRNATENICAICLDRPGGVRLRPCGHDYFCQTCTNSLFSCPLCRAPLLMEDGRPQTMLLAPTPQQIQAEMLQVAEARSVLSSKETCYVQVLCFAVWAFIFIFGIVEHMHGLVQTCEPGDPRPGTGHPDWLSVPSSEETCKACSPKNGIDCDMCSEGHYNLGTACFRYLENFPAMTTGAALGGKIYLVLIISTQFFGIATEVILIRRLVRRKLMPRKELAILLMALLIEVMRMFLVDIFVMQEYFGGRSYHIFREPVRCPDAKFGHDRPWQGADSHWYCNDPSPHGSHTSYYFASHQTAWSASEGVCSTFSTHAAILDFDEVGHQDISGHTRFKTVGWILGGEFALYYFFATFINEVADNMFVVPTTTRSGWLCKMFSISLEVFQLGALCPAAVFSHKDCLFYTDPLGIPLKAMSTVVVVFGYLIWGFIFVSLPLAVIGGGLLIILSLMIGLAASLARALRFVFRTSQTLKQAADGLERLQLWMVQTVEKLQSLLGQGCQNAMRVTMMMAFLPMLCCGIFLGTLVVVGQGSKKGMMHVLTALVLLSDVLFKIVATMVTELGDWLLHRRVTRLIEARTNQRCAAGCNATSPVTVVGRPAGDSESS